VSVEILDSAGTVVATFSNAPTNANPGGRGGRGGAGGGGIPNVSPLWRQAPEPFSTSAGMHRVEWIPVAGGGRGRGGGGRGGGAPQTGTFTARLTAGGKTYTQTFTVRTA
jgi:hypothetical protein